MNVYKKNNLVIVILLALWFVVSSTLVYFIYFNEPVVEEEKKDSIFVKVEDEEIIKNITDTIDKNNLVILAKYEKSIDYYRIEW